VSHRQPKSLPASVVFIREHHQPGNIIRVWAFIRFRMVMPES
jgi:hypothetical protein